MIEGVVTKLAAVAAEYMGSVSDQNLQVIKGLLESFTELGSWYGKVLDEIKNQETAVKRRRRLVRSQFGQAEF